MTKRKLIYGAFIFISFFFHKKDKLDMQKISTVYPDLYQNIIIITIRSNKDNYTL